MPLLRALACWFLLLSLAAAALVLLAVTWSPGLVMRVIAPRWGRWPCRVAGITLDVQGQEHLNAPAVIVSNHQSTLEIFIIPAVLPAKVRYVGKKEVGRIPLVGWVMRATGQILIDRQDPRGAIAALTESLKGLPPGVSVFVFPEGTRSQDGELGPFKKGAFHMALQLGLPIVPLTVDGAQRLMPKTSRLPRTGTVQVRISPPIDTRGWTVEGLDGHVAEVRAVIGGQLERLRAQASEPRLTTLLPIASGPEATGGVGKSKDA